MRRKLKSLSGKMSSSAWKATKLDGDLYRIDGPNNFTTQIKMQNLKGANSIDGDSSMVVYGTEEPGKDVAIVFPEGQSFNSPNIVDVKEDPDEEEENEDNVGNNYWLIIQSHLPNPNGDGVIDRVCKFEINSGEYIETCVQEINPQTPKAQ